MKPQDILFIVILALALFRKNPTYLVIGGLACLVLAIPLFQFQIFFTAQRLIMYAAAFLLGAIILFLFKSPQK